MDLKIYKTLWGVTTRPTEICLQPLLADYNGIEGPAPEEEQERKVFSQMMADMQLDYIAEITTAGSYVPDRTASLQDHLDSFNHKLTISMDMNPSHITCLGGCDAWPENQSIEFFGEAINMAKAMGVSVSFETHRGRSFFNPWTTRRICQQLPDLRLTCDFSHWCVVCERLLDIDAEDMQFFFARADHIHARVGYDQGPQIPGIESDRYAPAIKRHLDYWRHIWLMQQERGFPVSTITPEFGPDGYQAIDVDSGKPVGNLDEMNISMGAMLRQAFHDTGYHQSPITQNHTNN